MSDLPTALSAGALIRRARELAVPKMSIRAAAARIDMSPEQWGNIERGYRYTKNDEPPRSFDPPAATIAKMASVVGVTPAQLASTGREDAASALESLPGYDSSPVSPSPQQQSFISALQADSDEIEPYERQVWSEVADALGRYGQDATGAQVFPASPVEQATWNTHKLRNREEKVRLIAKLRSITNEAQSETDSWATRQRHTG
jgi:hypothetical protein